MRLCGAMHGYAARPVLYGAVGEGDQAVQDVGVRADLNRVGEAAAATDFRSDDCPGHVENMPGLQAVALEPSDASALDQPGPGEHAKMLQDRRPAHREVAGQDRHRLFAVPQQLQQAATIRFGDRSHQVRHVDTLVVTNVLGKPGARLVGCPPRDTP